MNWVMIRNISHTNPAFFNSLSQFFKKRGAITLDLSSVFKSAKSSYLIGRRHPFQNWLVCHHQVIQERKWASSSGQGLLCLTSLKSEHIILSSLYQMINLYKNFIRYFSLLFWNDAEHKLNQISNVLETEGAETKLILYSLLCKMRNGIICNN